MRPNNSNTPITGCGLRGGRCLECALEPAFGPVLDPDLDDDRLRESSPMTLAQCGSARRVSLSLESVAENDGGFLLITQHPGLKKWRNRLMKTREQRPRLQRTTQSHPGLHQKSAYSCPRGTDLSGSLAMSMPSARTSAPRSPTSRMGRQKLWIMSILRTWRTSRATPMRRVSSRR